MEDLFEYLQTNKKIEIEKLLPNKQIKRYKTVFYQKTDDDIKFFRPKEDDTYVEFLIDEIVRVLIYTVDGVFIFKTKVLKCGFKILKLELVKNYKKIQRRGLLRANIPLFANVEYKKENELKRNQIRLINISGSGLSFNIDDDLSNVNEIFINFKLEEKVIDTRIKIVEVRKNLRKDVEKYRISAQFVSLNNNEIEHIIKHCIRYQIKTIRRI